MPSKGLLDQISTWDRKLIKKYNGFGGKKVTIILKIISFLGRETIWLALIAFFLFIWYDPYIFAHISITFLIGVIIIVPIKILIKRSRPFEILSNLTVLERKPVSRSFPSWHTYNVMSQGLLFGYLSGSIVITISFLFIAIIVGFSRIQLGVHYPSDVIVGLIIGFFGFLLSIYLFSPLLLELIGLIEPYFAFEIQYYKFNSWLFENLCYLLLNVGIFLLIAIISSYKILKEIYQKKK